MSAAASITPPGDATAEATFDVRVSGDTVRITIRTPFGERDFSNIEVGTDRLTFMFAPGPPVRCTLLRREDKSYSGDCLDPDGDVGVIVMIPPGETRKP